MKMKRELEGKVLQKLFLYRKKKSKMLFSDCRQNSMKIRILPTIFLVWLVDKLKLVPLD